MRNACAWLVYLAPPIPNRDKRSAQLGMWSRVFRSWDTARFKRNGRMNAPGALFVKGNLTEISIQGRLLCACTEAIRSPPITIRSGCQPPGSGVRCVTTLCAVAGQDRLRKARS